MNRFQALSVWVLLISVAVLPVISTGSEEEPTESPPVIWAVVETLETELQVLPGEDLDILVDENGRILPSPVPLPARCRKALEIVPDWLREDLMLKFRVLPRDDAVILADIISEEEGNRTLDETAFVAAHLSVETIRNEYFFPELISHNSRLIYENDALVPYAEVVERENYTTIVYRTDEGILELPRDIYYWYVVHPDLGDEVPTYVDPDYNYTQSPSRDRDAGVPPPEGKFWREWFFVNNKTGMPLLPDLLNSTETLMDGILTVNSWISDSMRFTSDSERPNQPVRIYEKGIGRCGEYQDMRSAAGRAALLPVVPTSNSAEDHVWNEFWLGRWVHWDGTYDRPHIYEAGWGKTLSTVWNQRGDGFTWDVTDRYTGTAVIDVNVIDLNGYPADGAEVDIITEMYYAEELKTTTNSMVTDHTGKLSFMVGDDRNYWGAADGGELGKNPMSPNIAPTEIAMNTSVGEEYDITFRLPLAADRPLVRSSGEEPTSGRFRVEYGFEVLERTTRGRNGFTGDTFEDRREGGDITFFVTDQMNEQAYDIGSPFQGLDHMERVLNGSGYSFMEGEGPLNIHFYNGYSQRTAKTVKVWVKVYGNGLSSTLEDMEEDLEAGDNIFIHGTAISPEPLIAAHVMIEGFSGWTEAYIDNSEVGRYFFDSLIDTGGISPGNYNVWSRVSNANFTHYNRTELRVVDTTGPDIEMDRMPPGPYYDNERITLGGSVHDGHAVSSMYYVIDRDRTTLSQMAIPEDGIWELSMDLGEMGSGYHILEVFAEDPSGNTGSVEIDLEVMEKDPPRLRLSSPGEDRILVARGDIVLIEGTATDNDMVEYLHIYMDQKRNEDITDSMLPGGSFSYEWDTTKISDGEHLVEIRAADPSGNYIGVEFDLEVDGTPPDLIFNSGEDPIAGPRSDLFITGEVLDDNGVETMEFSVDGREWEDITRTLSGGEFELEIEGRLFRDEEDPRIRFRVSDGAGNRLEEDLAVIYDDQGPEIDLDPINGLYLRGETFKVSGQVSDDIELGVVTVYANGRGEVAYHSGPGMVVLDSEMDTDRLPLGDVEITVSAIDGVENEAEKVLTTRVVTRTTDTDGDKIPDWWEYLYGLDMDLPDAGEDPDDDGYTNFEEYLGTDGIAGGDDHTDPNDADSFPERADASGVSFIPVLLIIIALAVILAVIIFLFIRLMKRG